MAKKPIVTTLQSGFNSTEVLNQNFETLRDAFDNTLSLDGSTPNAMEADLDLNGNNIIGATGLLINGTDYLADVEAAKAAALVAQSAAELAENNAETAEVNAEASETAAANSATASASSASAASVSATAAQTAQAAAELAETTALIAENAAGIAQTDAAASAAAALASETAASTSETNAAASEAASSTSETNAAASAAAASTSETNAATSETNAANSATASASSATASAASATAASASETAAALSETAAAASEAAASTSETNAAASETAAAASETAAASSASSASTSASNAASSASSASASADAALAALDNFDDRYLGQKASDPTLDNDGDALVAGALYFNTTDEIMKVFDGSLWVAAYASLSGAMFGANNLSDVSSASDSRANLGLGTGDSPTFAGLTATGDVSFGDNDKAIFGAGSDLQIYHDGSNSIIRDVGTGDLRVQGQNLQLLSANGKKYFYGVQDAYTKLYYDNDEKLATTSTGIDVTGTVTADGLTVDGDAAILDSTGNTDFDVGGGTGQGTLRVYSPSKANSFSVLNNGTAFLTMSDGEINYRSKGASGQHTFKTTDSDTNRMIIANNGDISFYEDTGTTPKFFWDASGERLGVGATTPERTLHVNSGVTNGIATFESTDSNGVVWVADGNSANTSQVGLGAVTNDMLLYAGGSEAMRIDSSGNVGIGTASPSEKLEVAGVVLASQRFETTNQTVLRSTAAGGNNYLDFNTGTSSGNIIFRNGSSLFEDMRIDSSGNLLVGTTSGSDKVTVNGTVSATNFNTTSDATLKTNVETLTGSLDAVNALRGVSFDWIENGGSEVGFIAQEVEKVLPEVVSTNDQGIKSVKYGNMVAVLVEALKEQQLRIEALEAKLEG